MKKLILIVVIVAVIVYCHKHSINLADTASSFISSFTDKEPSPDLFEDIDSQITTAQIKSDINGKFDKIKKQLSQLENITNQLKDSEIANKSLETGKQLLNKGSKFLSEKISELGLDDNAGTKKSSSKSSSDSSYKFDYSQIPMENAPYLRQKLIDYSMTLRGIPYVYGGENPDTGLDCSAFVRYSSKNSVDIQLPRTASEMHKYVKSVSNSEKEPGDLIFFKNHGKVDHVGIYLGKYQGEGSLYGRDIFINAASAGKRTGVVISAMDEPYWKKHFFSVGRFLPSSNELIESVE